MSRAAKTNRIEANEEKANRDPITGEPGSHPIGTTIGTAIGASAGVATAIATGAAAGAALGPVGAAIGALAGGIFGAGVGHAMAEDMFPTQLTWWKENYQGRTYIKNGAAFDQYEPAYWYGIDAGMRYPEESFESLEPNIRNNWNLARGNSTLEWDDARPAVREAYDRMRAERLSKK